MSTSNMTGGARLEVFTPAKSGSTPSTRGTLVTVVAALVEGFQAYRSWDTLCSQGMAPDAAAALALGNTRPAA